jgi:hypothetical protein
MIYTGYFSQVHKYLEAGFTLLSIANKTPEGIKTINVSWLAPGAWIYAWKQKCDQIGASKRQLIDEYINKYIDDRLSHLSSEIIFKRLYDLANYNDVILLCYEKLPEGYAKDIIEINDLEPGKTFCHRHVVSAFLRNGGFECREYLIRKQNEKRGLF